MNRPLFLALSIIGTLLCLAAAKPTTTDTPADLAGRLFEVFRTQDKEALKKLWAAEEHLKKFLREMPQNVAPKTDKQRAEWVAEALRRQAIRIERP